MNNLWKQIHSKRFKWVLPCTLVLAFAFAGFSFFVSSKDELPPGMVLTTTVSPRALPVIDQAIVEQIEFALFALG